MKITPFQQALKTELSRLERLSQQSNQASSLLSRNFLPSFSKPIKSRSFLVQLFQRTRIVNRKQLFSF